MVPAVASVGVMASSLFSGVPTRGRGASEVREHQPKVSHNLSVDTSPGCVCVRGGGGCLCGNMSELHCKKHRLLFSLSYSVQGLYMKISLCSKRN